MRKSVILIVMVIVISVFSPITAVALSFEPDFVPESDGIYMVNTDTDTVVYQKNADKKMYPASTTKILTAILAIENVKDLQTEVTYPLYIQDQVSAINYAEYGGALSTAGLLGGEVLTMEKLLYGAMLPSGNECAYIIADYVGGGSVDKFVEMMNAKAKELGATNSNFVNPAGLSNENHYTTPHDMYLIAKYAMQNDIFRKIVSTTTLDGGPTNMHEELRWNNTNMLINSTSPYYYSPVKGIKTGTLDSAGRCFVSLAQKDGFEYIMVVFGAPIYDDEGKPLPNNMAFVETTKLYKWAFSTFSIKSILDQGDLKDEIPLRLAKGQKDHLKLMCGESYSALLPENVDADSFQLISKLPESVDAPIAEGDKVGELKLMLAAEEVGSIPLVSAETVDRSAFLFVLDSIHKVLGSFGFKFLIVLTILLVIAYIWITIIRNRNRMKYRSVRRRRNL